MSNTSKQKRALASAAHLNNSFYGTEIDN